MRALEVVEAVLEEKGLYLAPDKKAQLVGLVYEELEDTGELVDNSRILKLIHLAA